jgi:hypothetical protein
MNLTTIGNIVTSGLTLVVAALAGAVLSSSYPAGAPASLAAASVSAPSAWQRGPSEHTTVIATSEQHAMQLMASIFQDIDPSWYAAYAFVVDPTPEEEALIAYGVAEANREDPGVPARILDMRGGRVKSDFSSQQRAASQADIDASVLSTELAHFGN